MRLMAVMRPGVRRVGGLEVFARLVQVSQPPDIPFEQMRPVVAFPDRARSHQEIDVLRRARFVLPVFERGAGAVALDLPFVGLLNQLGVAAQRHDVEPAAHADHVVAEVFPSRHRLLVLTRLRHIFPAAIVATPAFFAGLFVDHAGGVALPHPGGNGVVPGAVHQADAPSFASAQQIIDYGVGVSILLSPVGRPNDRVVAASR